MLNLMNQFFYSALLLVLFVTSSLTHSSFAAEAPVYDPSGRIEGEVRFSRDRRIVLQKNFLYAVPDHGASFLYIPHPIKQLSAPFVISQTGRLFFIRDKLRKDGFPLYSTLNLGPHSSLKVQGVELVSGLRISSEGLLIYEYAGQRVLCSIAVDQSRSDIKLRVAHPRSDGALITNPIDVNGRTFSIAAGALPKTAGVPSSRRTQGTFDVFFSNPDLTIKLIDGQDYPAHKLLSREVAPASAELVTQLFHPTGWAKDASPSTLKTNCKDGFSPDAGRRRADPLNDDALWEQARPAKDPWSLED